MKTISFNNLNLSCESITIRENGKYRCVYVAMETTADGLVARARVKCDGETWVNALQKAISAALNLLPTKIENARENARKNAVLSDVKASANANLITVNSVIKSLNQGIKEHKNEIANIKEILGISSVKATDLISRGEVLYTLHRSTAAQKSKDLGEFDKFVTLQEREYILRGVVLGSLNSKQAITRVIASLKSHALLFNVLGDAPAVAQFKAELEK